MLKNNQEVIVKTFVPKGVVVERKFFGEGEDESIHYLVEFETSEDEKATRWFTEEELEAVK